jgi:hypothetical protein
MYEVVGECQNHFWHVDWQQDGDGEWEVLFTGTYDDGCWPEKVSRFEAYQSECCALQSFPFAHTYMVMVGFFLETRVLMMGGES